MCTFSRTIVKYLLIVFCSVSREVSFREFTEVSFREFACTEVSFREFA